MFTKIKNTEIYARKVKLSWVKDLLYGNLPEEEIAKYTMDLVNKIACDKDGNDIPEDDLYFDDFVAVQKYIMGKLNLMQKKS